MHFCGVSLCYTFCIASAAFGSSVVFLFHLRHRVPSRKLMPPGFTADKECTAQSTMAAPTPCLCSHKLDGQPLLLSRNDQLYKLCLSLPAASSSSYRTSPMRVQIDVLNLNLNLKVNLLKMQLQPTDCTINHLVQRCRCGPGEGRQVQLPQKGDRAPVSDHHSDRRGTQDAEGGQASRWGVADTTTST